MRRDRRARGRLGAVRAALVRGPEEVELVGSLFVFFANGPVEEAEHVLVEARNLYELALLGDVACGGIVSKAIERKGAWAHAPFSQKSR